MSALSRMLDPRYKPYVDRLNRTIQHSLHVSGIHHHGLISYVFSAWAVFYAKASGRDSRHFHRLIDVLWEQLEKPQQEDATFVQTIGEWADDRPIEGEGKVKTSVEIVDSHGQPLKKP